MRKIVLAAAMAGTALTLAACSENTEDADTATTEAEMADAADTGVADAGMMAETAGVMDANTATAEELAGVEGISSELADAIVSGQPYADVTAFNAALMETLSEEEAASVLENVFIPINLNDASEEAIALVPGMSERMVGEFLEYRPYADMNEFNREIGKYVDEEEVARFRQYVTL